MDEPAMSSTCEDGPKAKKLKTSHEVDTTSFTPSWAHLPYLAMVEIFGFLNKEDVINTSSVCRNWRENYFLPRFSNVTFSIQKNNIEKARFLTNKFGHTVTHAKVVLDSCGECVKEFINLLQKLSGNDNLDSLYISHSQGKLHQIGARLGRLVPVCLVCANNMDKRAVNFSNEEIGFLLSLVDEFNTCVAADQIILYAYDTNILMSRKNNEQLVKNGNKASKEISDY